MYFYRASTFLEAVVARPKVTAGLVNIVDWLAEDFEIAVVGVGKTVAAVVAVPAESSARGAL
jgi:hypothetical protein